VGAGVAARTPEASVRPGGAAGRGWGARGGGRDRGEAGAGERRGACTLMGALRACVQARTLSPPTHTHTLSPPRSVGCILAELLGRRPLFPGKDYVHQINLITRVGGGACVVGA
jgi:hypothetical protein